MTDDDIQQAIICNGRPEPIRTDPQAAAELHAINEQRHTAYHERLCCYALGRPARPYIGIDGWRRRLPSLRHRDCERGSA